MARPIKHGLEYFPFDVGFFDDPKILFVADKFGEKGELVTVKLLAWIYRNGYYIEWDDDVCMIFTRKSFTNVKVSLVQNVVAELLKRGFFSESIFKSFGVLTSAGIQKRWLMAIKNSRRVAKISPHLNLIDDTQSKNLGVSALDRVVSSEETPLNHTETPLNHTEMQQRKGKERKVKKRKEKEKVKKEKEKIPAHSRALSFPTKEEVLAFAEANNVALPTAEKFYDHYEAQGWTLGNGLPIRNWQAKLKQWDLTDKRKEIEDANAGKGDERYEFDEDDHKRRVEELERLVARHQRVKSAG